MVNEKQVSKGLVSSTHTFSAEFYLYDRATMRNLTSVENSLYYPLQMLTPTFNWTNALQICIDRHTQTHTQLSLQTEML